MKSLPIRILFCCAALGLASLARAELTIIVNPKVAGEQLDAATVKNVLLGRKVAWDQAGRIKLAVLKNDAADAFLQQTVNMSASAFNNHWRRLIMTGAGSAPKTFTEEAELRAYVATTEGAIGFVDQEQLDASVSAVALHQ